MNIEIVNELKKFVREGNEQIEEIKAEYAEITSLTHEQTAEDVKRIKEIRQTVAPLAERIKNVESDLSTYEDLANEVNFLNERVKSAKSEDSIRIATRLRDHKVKEFETFEEILKTSYADILQEVIITDEETEEVITDEETCDLDKENKTKRNRYIGGGITLVALIAALAILVNANSKKNNKQATTSNEPLTEVTETMKPEVTSTPAPTATPELTLVTKELEQGFRDITDKEALTQRAQEIILELDKSYNHDLSVEDIENIINWYNGGLVKDNTVDSAIYSLDLTEQLMNKENIGEAKSTFDMSKFFIDGSRGQKLVKQLYEVRVKIFEAKTEEEKESAAQEFAHLYLNSVVKDGANDTISAYRLETSGMEAFVDNYFINTYLNLNERRKMDIEVGDELYYLDEIIDMIMFTDCEDHLSKFSSDVLGMAQNAKIDDTYKLTK